MWRWQKLTLEFGPVGFGWRYEILEHAVHAEADETAVRVLVALYVKRGGEWSEPIIGWGGALLVAKEKGGRRLNDEAYKMATTDALGTAAKLLGLAADVYMRRWDGSKYVDDESLPATPEEIGGGRRPAQRQRQAAQVDEVPLDWPSDEPPPEPPPDMARAGETSGAGRTNFEPLGSVVTSHPRFNPDEPPCPSCGKQMWDNREPDRGGKGKYPKKNPKQPDFKCRDKECDGVLWPAHRNR
jgi:hypothetical protein